MLVVVFAASLALVTVPGRPAATPSSQWLLTNNQLIAAVQETSSASRNVGRVVVAQVSLLRLAVDCANPPCAPVYALRGAGLLIHVLGLPDAPTCPPSATSERSSCTLDIPTSGAMAVKIGPGNVTILGWVRVGPDDGAWSPGGAAAVLSDPSSRQGRMVVVNGWLTGFSVPIACPEVQPSGGVGIPGPYSCGDAAWITRERYIASTTDSAGAVAIAAPPKGLRVQNGAYERFAEHPTGSADPRQGWYLIDATADRTACFSCPLSGGRALLVSRIDPIDLPAAPLSTQSVTPPPVPSGPMTTLALSPWSLDLAGLVGAVATARNGGGAGRTVVADVTYDIDPSDPNCRGNGSPDCLIVVRGSSPPIHVLDTLNANICPATWLCSFRAMPIIPGAAPAALRLRPDGDVEYVGPIRTPTSGGLGYTSGDLATYLGRLSSNDLDAYRLYVVSGWMSQGMFELKCLQISSDPDHQFSCGRAAWLSDTDYQPNQVGANDYGLVAPRPAIRLPNESYLTWAPGPPWAGSPSLLEPRYGTFLVRPVIPVPTSCFACADATAEVVARLDPPLAQPTASSPSASPSVAVASLDPEAAYALASAETFEHSRATGDWQGAWVLLGPATRAVFGSEEQFAQQEAAYNATGATTYEISDPSRDPDLLSPSYLGTAASEIQLQTAWYVAVTHPLVEGASAGFEGLVVGSGTDGQRHVWIVH